MTKPTPFPFPSNSPRPSPITFLSQLCIIYFILFGLLFYFLCLLLLNTNLQIKPADFTQYLLYVYVFRADLLVLDNHSYQIFTSGSIPCLDSYFLPLQLLHGCSRTVRTPSFWYLLSFTVIFFENWLINVSHKIHKLYEVRDTGFLLIINPYISI